jgi:hypothetical protein
MTGNGIQLDPPIEKIDGEESWLPVVGLEESYLVSSYGRIYSRIHHKLLKPTAGRRVVLAGLALSVPELVLEAHGGQPRPVAGMIAWPIDRDARWPYQVQNLVWRSRAEMLTILSRERAAKLAESAASRASYGDKGGRA